MPRKTEISRKEKLRIKFLSETGAKKRGNSSQIGSKYQVYSEGTPVPEEVAAGRWAAAAADEAIRPP